MKTARKTAFTSGFTFVLALVIILGVTLACSPAKTTNTPGTSANIGDNASQPATPATGTQTTPKKTTTPPPPPKPANPNLPVIDSFVATPAILDPGGVSVLKWVMRNATSISISPDIGPVDPNGTVRVSPDTSTVYTLTATNSHGAVTAVTTVMVVKPYASLLPVVLSLTAQPRTVSENNTTVLNWNVYGATVVTIYTGKTTTTTATSGGSTLSGTILITATTPAGRKIDLPAYVLDSTQTSSTTPPPIQVANNLYTLEARNWVGSRVTTTDIDVLRSAIIPKPGIPIAYDNMTVTAATVLPIINYFSADPLTVVQGNSSVLTWEVMQADKVLLNGAEVPLSGTRVFSPAGTTGYSLTAVNQYYTLVKVITISVLGYNADWFKPLRK